MKNPDARLPMKKSVCLPALLLAVLLLVGAPALAAGPPLAVFPELEFDFGQVPSPAPTLSHDFPVGNQGKSPLEILSVSPG
jgi:hypothetical protein